MPGARRAKGGVLPVVNSNSADQMPSMSRWPSSWTIHEAERCLNRLRLKRFGAVGPQLAPRVRNEVLTLAPTALVGGECMSQCVNEGMIAPGLG